METHESFYASGNNYKPIMDTVKNQKMSLILVLSIVMLAGVIITGVVVNIVSAANSIKVQTKTIQHPITSKGSPHIAPTIYKTRFFRMGIGPSDRQMTWLFSGELDGAIENPPFLDVPTYYGISHAPIILGVLAKDHHFGWQYPGQTNEDGTFSGTFHLCDNDTTKDHSFYFTVYFKGGDYRSAYDGGKLNPVSFKETSSEGSTSWGPWRAQMCPR
jgi:hypothetical protein